MEMHQLKYFVAVAETSNFSRAAERCNVSQPSLSQQIIKLEQEIGQPLFDRAGRRVLLTEAGRLLLDHARTILTTADNATRQLRDARQVASGRLAVGVIPTIAPYILPGAIESFSKECPRVELTIQEDYTQRLITSLCEGELDVAIAALPVKNDRIGVEVLGTDPLLVVMPRGHRLAKRRQVTWDDLKEERWIVINEMHCLGEQIASVCSQHLLQPGVICRSAQLSTVQALVAMDQGVSLLPAMARDADRSPRRVYCEMRGDRPARTIVALRHRNRYQTSQARQFTKIIEAHLRGG